MLHKCMAALHHWPRPPRFSDPNPAAGTGMVPSSRSRAHPSQYNGFSKSTKVHRFGEKLDTAGTLRQNHPYVSRWVYACEGPNAGNAMQSQTITIYKY